jgi:hypothetical protein
MRLNPVSRSFHPNHFHILLLRRCLNAVATLHNTTAINLNRAKHKQYRSRKNLIQIVGIKTFRYLFYVHTNSLPLSLSLSLSLPHTFILTFLLYLVLISLYASFLKAHINIFSLSISLSHTRTYTNTHTFTFFHNISH